MTERVKPIPKPRKSLVKRSATVNHRVVEKPEELVRSTSSKELSAQIVDEVIQPVKWRTKEEPLICTYTKKEEDNNKQIEMESNFDTRINENTNSLNEQAICVDSSACEENQNLSMETQTVSIEMNETNESMDTIGEPSLWDRITRTHPIWYLSQLQNRFAVCHILRPMEPGTFIVRPSSQQNSIALSVRMPPSWPVEIEHYLIEKLENGVKLEGSQNVFLSLAFLIHHYCSNGEEIQCRLQLPEAVRSLKSNTDLDKLALMGQDFWSSEMSRPTSVYKNDLWPLSQSMHGLATAQHFDTDGNQTSPEMQTEPRRRSTMRLGTNALSHDYYSPPSYADSLGQQKKRPIQMGTSGLLKKSYSAYGIAAPREEDYNYTNGRSLKARSRRPAEFLRNLFSSNPTDQQTNKIKRDIIRQQPRILTQSDDYFLPKTLSNLNDSPSFWSKTSLEQSSPRDCEWSENFLTRNSVKPNGDQQKHRRPVERLLSASSSVGRRLKAFTKQPEKCTKDDLMFGSTRVDEHQALRRQNTDLCGSRLANFVPSSTNRQKPNSSMPGRFHTGPIVPPHAGRMSNNSMQCCIDELRLKRAANGSTSSKASSRTNDSDEHSNVVLRVQEKPTQIPTFRDMSSRMSVPNLSASEPNSNANGEETRMSKLGRAPGTGELQTINEGLITPIVRRKYTNGHRQIVQIPSAQTKHDDPKHSRSTSDEQATRQFQKQLADELNNLAAKSTNNKSIHPQDPDNKISTFGQKNLLRTRSAVQPSTSSTSPNGIFTQTKRDDTPTFVHKVQPSWSAVNLELKRRQLQIAKVKPQPVARTRQSASTKSTADFDRIAQKAMDTSDVKTKQESLQQSGPVNGIEPLAISSLDDANDLEDDDVVSTAGTVFNEPWDSNALENLLDIAQFCDERPSKAKAKAAYMECCTHETIAEEEDNCSYCGSNSTTSISPYSHTSGNAPSPEHNSIEVRQVSLSPEDKVEDDLFYGADNNRPCSSELPNNNDILNLANNRIWNETSKRVPSEPSSTFDSRKDNRSRSMLNVASEQMTPIMERQQFRLRAQTPGNVFNNHSNFNDSLDSFNTILPATSPARLRTTTDPGQKIQNYIEKLAIDSTSTFGASLQCFVECTIDSDNNDPKLVIRNARQFITGIKNYLTNGEAIQEIIEQESAKLQSNEFLNIDAILEAVLHKIVLVTIKPHVYHLFCRENIKNGSFETLTSNLSLVRTFPIERLGFPSTTKTPDMKTIELVRKYMRKMQNHYSPLKKFENLLNALSLVAKPANSTLLRVDSSKKQPCTEIIRWLVYLLAKTSCVTCEIEAYYMWELLTPQLLTTGHVIYYLSTLFSAIHILKNSDSIERLKFLTESPTFTTPQASLQSCINEAADGYFRCCIPNEHSGTIDFRVFPMVSQLTVQRLCQIIATQLSISNSEEYGLFALYDACETLLHGTECPLNIRTELNSSGKAHFFAYKRLESKIAWPASAVQLTTSTSMNQPMQGTFGSAQSRYV